jgi:hypothetical protein
LWKGIGPSLEDTVVRRGLLDITLDEREGVEKHLSGLELYRLSTPKLSSELIFVRYVRFVFRLI